MGFLVLLLFAQQGFAVGDGDLVVVGMNFAESEETVAVAAIFDKGRLQGGFDPGDLGEVDIASELPPGGGFEVEFL